jgi:hypothetical protein
MEPSLSSTSLTKTSPRPDEGAGERVVGGDEVLHLRAVHDGGIAAGGGQDPADHAGDGGLAAGAGDADAEGGGVEQLLQQLGAGHGRGADAAGGLDVGDGLLHGGGGDQDLVGADQARAVLREQADAAPLQPLELGGRSALVAGPVGAGDLRALGLDDQRQGQHAAAADAAEEVGPTHRGRL